MKYEEEYKKLHEKGHFGGNSLKEEYVEHISELVRTTASTSLLDYGCGKAINYLKHKIHNRFGITDSGLFLYDPGVPQFSRLTKEGIDGVVCTDVIEHVPEEEIPNFLQTIFSKAEKFVFITIHCGLAVKTFPDGTNVHVTVKEPKWWDEQLKKYNVNNIKLGVRYVVPMREELNPLKLTLKEARKYEI